MNYQIEVIELATARGLTPSQLTPEQYDAIAREVRTAAALVRDGATMLTAKCKSRIRIGLVPRAVRETNLDICRTNRCGSFTRLGNGEETCLRCNCRGEGLASKAEQRNQYCPADPPYWDNRKVAILTVEGSPA